MKKLLQTDTFRLWESNLKDLRARKITATRLFRLANSLAGDVSAIGEGISELRIYYSVGYRIYF